MDDYTQTQVSLHKCLIWNNKYITHQNKSLFLVNWFSKTILLVSQLLTSSNGHVLTYLEFLEKLSLYIPVKEYMMVINAIPSEIIRK